MAWEAELWVAKEAADAAADILRTRGSLGPERVVFKGEADIVTDVDLKCEAAIREILERHTPAVPILGEETGGAVDAKTRWVVDPLDGTTNFVHGFPMYCVSVALEVDAQTVVGVIADPLRGQVYSARRGHGARAGEVPIHVSKCDRLSRALVATGFPADRHDESRFYVAYVEAVLRRVQCIRRAGSAAMDLVMVAMGVLDAYWEFNLNPWDVAAGVLLVEEAGGRVSGHAGGPLDAIRPCPLASNGLLHEKMMGILGSVVV